MEDITRGARLAGWWGTTKCWGLKKRVAASTHHLVLGVKKRMGEEFETIHLPRELVEKVRRRAETTGFGSVEDYIKFVLEEVVEEEEETVMSEEEEESVKARLRSLGYLD